MPTRLCLRCRTPIRRGSRCSSCLAEQKAPYTSVEYKANRLLVLERDGYRCRKMRNGRRCNRPANTADHVIPISAGGTSAVENMEAACLGCNSAKRDR